MQQFSHLKIALVHDFLNQYGGAERVLETLSEMFPEAPIYTILYEKDKMDGKFQNREIRTSFFQKLPKFLRRRFKLLFFLLPVAPETFDLREFDLVISSSGAWSKGIVTRLNTIHIAYIHSPMRFVWDYNEKYLGEERKRKWGIFLRPILSYLRLWDKLAADRPEYLIANSNYTKERIKKYYGRESKVVYPPVRMKSEIRSMKSETNSKLENINLKQDIKYFLIISRLSAYKKIDVAVRAFNKLKLPLMIAGTGKEEKRLRQIAGENIKFLGWVNDEKRKELYKNARAFVFPGIDDFGIAPAEALVHSVPVIAMGEGGIKEIVETGKTGEFFEEQTVESLEKAVKRFLENEEKYDREYIRQSMEKFSEERFKKEIELFINDKIGI